MAGSGKTTLLQVLPAHNVCGVRIVFEVYCSIVSHSFFACLVVFVPMEKRDFESVFDIDIGVMLCFINGIINVFCYCWY